MDQTPQPAVRLYAILARKAPAAVIFRRGHSKRVLLVNWRTDRDEFSEGRWLKGRIYERRCDLSPSGGRLIYMEHAVADKESGASLRLGRTDWADWCHAGGLVFAKEGRLYRLGMVRGELPPPEEARLLVDLTARAFKPLEPPEGARLWGGTLD